jgi:putative copper resistance protein D
VTKPKTLLGLLAALTGTALAIWLGMTVSGAAKPLSLGDPGDVVRWASPLSQGATNLFMAVTIGTLVVAAWALPDASARLKKALDLAAFSAAAWFLFGFINLFLIFVSVTDVPISASSKFSKALWQFITEVPLGQYHALSLVAAALVATFALMASSLRATLFIAILSILSLVPLALTGHAAGATGHAMAVNSIGLHLLAITVWVGGLVAVLSLKTKDAAENAALVSRYSTLALIAFAVTAVSGAASALVRIPTLDLLFSNYGLLVIAKVVILGVLGVFGWVYRSRVIGRLASGGAGLFARLAVAELLFMGLASGLGTSLSKTAPPEVPGAGFVEFTPAQILTGEVLPPELTAAGWFTTWKIDIFWAVVCAGLLVAYLYGVWRLHKRGDKWSVGRTSSWIAGVLLLFYITNGAMNAYEQYLFSVHMIAHMMLTMAVPVLLVPGAPVTLLVRASEKRHDGSRGLREWVLWAVHTPWARFVSNPLVAAALFASSLVVFYFTPIFAWATREHVGHEWMIVHFLITGYLFVQALIGVDPGPRQLSHPIKLMLLILTLTFHAFFGLGLMQGETLLLADWYGAMARTWGDTPLGDQQTGGAIAWGVGELPSAVLTIIVSIQWFRADAREQRRADRASDRTGNQDIEEYNAMLARLAGRKEER